jgi:NAD(P)-dependent dehydrogenase (short-subunit alcohol dehydrogenase family)
MPVQASITPFSGTRVAIVTGGAQGIGKAMALRLASDGFDICVDDLASSAGLLDDVVSEIQQLGRKAMALSYDVTKENEVKKLVEETVAELGSLDLVSTCSQFLFPASDFL